MNLERCQRNRIINTAVAVLMFATGIYIFWTYFVVHYWATQVGLPWAQYNESWALPASAIVLGAGMILYLVRFRGSRRE